MAGVAVPVSMKTSPPSTRRIPSELLDSDIIKRSIVLKCIVDSGGDGDALLPDTITLSDFIAWVAAVKGGNTNFESMDFASMCNVMKVGDALDDIRIDVWIDLAAKSLVQYSTTSSFTDRRINLAHSCLQLAHGLQHRFLASAVSKAGCVYRLLRLLPTSLHTAVLAATITPSKALQAPIVHQNPSFLVALAAMPASPASCLSLDVHDNRTGPSFSSECMPETAPHLARALSHHSNLTSLHIRMAGITATTAELLLPAISTLTSIQSLRLGACDETLFPAESLPSLQQALHALPQLQDFTIFTCDGLESGRARPLHPSPKRMRGAGADAPVAAPAAPTSYSITDTLAAATALTSLHIGIYLSPPDFIPRNVIRATTRLRLPHLRQLTATIASKTQLAAAIISRVTAPLTSLTLDHEVLLSPRATGIATRFLAGLRKFTELRSLTAALPRCDSAHSTARGIHDIVAGSTPAALAALSHLRDLTCEAEYPVLLRAVPVLAAALTALTQLRLNLCQSYVDAMSVWDESFGHLGQLPLRSLELDFQRRFGAWHAGPSMAALQPLTRLTALHVRGWQCIRTLEDCVAVATMVSLRQLFLDSEAAPHEGTLPALLMLPAVTTLVMGVYNVNFDGVVARVLAAHPPGAAWPALQRLSLVQSHPFSKVEDVVRWAARLPALRQLAVPLSWPASAYGDAGGWTALSDGTMHKLSTIAADAGIALSLPRATLTST